jgi:AcrR family transcriptional regulator
MSSVGFSDLLVNSLSAVFRPFMSQPSVTPAKQTRNPERTRRLILQAATRLFSRRGYDGVPVDDIVAAAKVNKRMVYHYFGSKEGLYSEVLQKVFQRLSDFELQAFDAAETPEQMIANVLRSYFRFLGENPEFVALLSWENLHHGRFVNKHPGLLSKTPILRRLDEAVSAGITTGVFHPGIDSKHLLISLISLCFVYHANRFTLSISVDLDLQSGDVLEEGLSHAVDLVLNGLRSRKAVDGRARREIRALREQSLLRIESIDEIQAAIDEGRV